MTGAVLLLGACTLGERALLGCPQGEVCSDVTPQGLHFYGAGITGALSFGPADTAIGGTQHVALAHAGVGTYEPLTTGYSAVIDGRALAVDGIELHEVTLRGVEPGEAYLRIVDRDGLLMDRKIFGTAALESISIVGSALESSQLPVAFLPGTIRVGIGLHGRRPEDPTRTYRIVDESMMVELAGAERVTWDTLEVPDAAVGTLQLTVTAGELPATTLDIVVVPGVEELVAHLTKPLVAGTAGSVCFDARSGTHHVTGLEWTFASDSPGASTFLDANCLIVWPAQAGTLSVTASAGGLSRTVVYPVAAAAAPAAGDGVVLGDPPEDHALTAGERALAATSP